MRDRIYAWIVALFILGIIIGCFHACFGQEKFRIRPWVDSVLVAKATWDTDTVLVKGDKDCQHEWLTQFEEQKYPLANDSTRNILNPRGERVVQEVCVICNRQRIKSETITFIWKKKRM